MRALTVRQPWAWAIVHAGKDIENRSWTNRHAISTIAIHAGYGVDPLEELPRGVKKPGKNELIRGAIIGVVDVVDIVDRHRSKWFIGPLGSVLRNPRRLREPIFCKGRLGLWQLPQGAKDKISRQLGRRGLRNRHR